VGVVSLKNELNPRIYCGGRLMRWHVYMLREFHLVGYSYLDIDFLDMHKYAPSLTRFTIYALPTPYLYPSQKEALSNLMRDGAVLMQHIEYI
jgi:hypothetical protein